MKPVLTDAEQVAAIRGGDPSAWGPVFDRYRDAVYGLAWSITRADADAEDVVSATFLRGAESIAQLRDPDRLRPWLMSIARRESLNRVRSSRAHEVTIDPSTGLDELVGSDPESPVAGIQRAEVIQLVEAAFAGLDPKDRAVLELAERQEMSGDDLAESLGVNRDNAYAMVHNAKARFELSVSSLIVARTGRDVCLDLDLILARWDGNLTPLIRKRIARHVKKCDVCESTRRQRVTPAALLGLLPVVTIPTLVADQAKAAAIETAAAGSAGEATIGAVTAGFSAKTLVAVAAALVCVVGVLGLVALDRGEDGAAGDGDGQAVGTATRLADADQAPGASDAALVTPTPTEPIAAPEPTPTEPIAAPEPTPVRGADPCDAAGALYEFASPGPASGSAADVRHYLTTTNDLLHVVVVAYGDLATDEIKAYEAAYQKVIAAGIWDLSRLPDGQDLAALGSTVEQQLASDCGPFG